MTENSRSPIVVGTLLALGAAVAFGLTTPIIAYASDGLGALTTACLLYAGAAGISLALKLGSRVRGSSLGVGDAPRLALVALFGAAIAPTLLVWGVARTGATVASLVLNLEAAFTVALAWIVYREPIGTRVGAAVVAMLVGGGLLAFDEHDGAQRIGGVLAVVLATACWAADNTFTRAFSERDPADVVLFKSTLGALATGTLGVLRGEPIPGGRSAALLLACGAIGYGLSLRLYLLAQRRIGAARTGSVFAVGPFIGAAVAWLAGTRDAHALTLLGALAFGLGVYLHVTEKHRHPHRHPALEHEHAHRHDDGHHDDHRHDPPVLGEHVHLHRHEAREHDHEHGVDLHHDHVH